MTTTIKTIPHIDSTEVSIMATIDQNDMLGSPAVARALMEDIIHQIAVRYVEENYAAIASKLDQQAIANLSVAEAGQRIAKAITERPVVLKENTTNIHNTILSEGRH